MQLPSRSLSLHKLILGGSGIDLRRRAAIIRQLRSKCQVRKLARTLVLQEYIKNAELSQTTFGEFGVQRLSQNQPTNPISPYC